MTFGYNNSYQPYPTYNPYQPMQDNLSQLRQATQNAPQQAQQNCSGLIWVSGENAAKAFLVAPNTSVLLMDAESNRFFIKTSDASGMPLPLRIFEYTEKTQNAQQQVQNVATQQRDDFITRKEFDDLKAEIDALRKENANESTVSAT